MKKRYLKKLTSSLIKFCLMQTLSNTHIVYLVIWGYLKLAIFNLFISYCQIHKVSIYVPCHEDQLKTNLLSYMSSLSSIQSYFQLKSMAFATASACPHVRCNSIPFNVFISGSRPIDKTSTLFIFMTYNPFHFSCRSRKSHFV